MILGLSRGESIPKLVASLALLSCLGATCLEAQDIPREGLSVAAEGDAWYASPGGWIFITRGSQPGTATRARVGNEFGLDSEVLPVARAEIRFWDLGALGFRLVPAEESGTHTASDSFVYHGQTYAAGRSVSADVGFLLVDLDYQYAWNLDDRVTLTAHAGAEYWGFSSHLRTVDALPPVDERRSFSSGYWLAGADLEDRLTDGLSAKLTFLGGLTGSSRFFLEADAGMAWRLLPHLSLTAAYRLHQVRFHTSTNQANLLFQGPSLGLELGF